MLSEATFENGDELIAQAGRAADNYKENPQQFGHTSPGGYHICRWLDHSMRGTQSHRQGDRSHLPGALQEVMGLCSA